MKKQYFINANIVDPQNSINEVGGLIIGEDGKIEAVGKKVNTNNLPSREKPIDLKSKYISFINSFYKKSLNKPFLQQHQVQLAL